MDKWENPGKRAFKFPKCKKQKKGERKIYPSLAIISQSGCRNDIQFSSVCGRVNHNSALPLSLMIKCSYRKGNFFFNLEKLSRNKISHEQTVHTGSFLNHELFICKLECK